MLLYTVRGVATPSVPALAAPSPRSVADIKAALSFSERCKMKAAPPPSTARLCRVAATVGEELVKTAALKPGFSSGNVGAGSL